MPPMLIETERTPNPATRKFLPGRTVMETGGRDFPNADAAEASPLASALFATDMVDGVYFGRDFISVSAAPTVEWDQLEPEILSVLLDHFMLDAPLFRQGSAAGIEVAPESELSFEDDPADADIIDQLWPLALDEMSKKVLGSSPNFWASTNASHVAAMVAPSSILLQILAA